MDLPNYFLADLPPHAALSPTMLREACQTLRRNRAQYLVGRPTHAIIDTLSEVAHNWLEPNDPFRQLALDQAPAALGFSKPTLEHGLDRFFRQLTYDGLLNFVLQELGQIERIDRFVVTEPELRSRRSAVATGPELLVQITAGNVPPPTLMSIVLGFLARSAQFLKCARHTSLLPRLFAHSIYAVEPKLASCLEIAEWPGGTSNLEDVLFDQADCVTATGRDETLTAIQQRLPRRTRFLGYGHRVSFGFIAREALSRYHAREIAAAAARDVASWDQLGCLSPHAFYTEHGASVTPELFAQMLAEALASIETTQPRGTLTPEAAATVANRRALYQVRAANLNDTLLWCSPAATAWTVVCEADPRFEFSCLHRFVYVKGVANLADALQGAAAVQGNTSTVSLAAIGQRAQEIALELARWGVTRVCPVGQMQDPPLCWRHDGRPTLGDLVTWTDWEQ